MLSLSTQANNAYIFPGFGLGLVISGAIRVHDDMLLTNKTSKLTEISVDRTVHATLSILHKVLRAGETCSQPYKMDKNDNNIQNLPIKDFTTRQSNTYQVHMP